MDQIIKEVIAEYQRASDKFPPFHSAHEGYAVIQEEVDELWDCIKGNLAPNLTRDEAVQVAAMALRFIVDVCDRA